MRSKARIIAVFSVILGLWVVSGCYYDSTEYLYPAQATTCDTTNITYSGTINPIIIDKCNSCHSIAGPLGNTTTEGYSNLKKLADNGKLYGSVSHSKGYVAMPNDGSNLSACQILYIKLWVNAGAPNN